MQHTASFTIRYPGFSPVLKSEVDVQAIGVSGDIVKKRFVAIWDTGATSTVVTPKVAAELGLAPISYVQIATPSGTMNCSQYYVDMVLPQNVTIKDILATEAIPANCDALIGMDIISLGDFAVTNAGDETVFSFRIPSIQEIDFVSFAYSPSALEPPTA